MAASCPVFWAAPNLRLIRWCHGNPTICTSFNSGFSRRGLLKLKHLEFYKFTRKSVHRQQIVATCNWKNATVGLLPRRREDSCDLVGCATICPHMPTSQLSPSKLPAHLLVRLGAICGKCHPVGLIYTTTRRKMSSEPATTTGPPTNNNEKNTI